jgi:GAF domain-containing protein
MTARTPTDWTPVRLAYVNGQESYAALAARLGLSESAVEKRGEREGWKEERRKQAEAIGATAQEHLSKQRAAELSKFNEDDLKVAKALRAQVAAAIATAQRASRAIAAKDLRSLASALESAQRVGRLALGASTDNSSVFSRELPAGVDEFV